MSFEQPPKPIPEAPSPRKKERETKAEEVMRENVFSKVINSLREGLTTPEKVIGSHDMQVLRDAGIVSKKEITWIAEVKLFSQDNQRWRAALLRERLRDKSLTEEEKEHRKSLMQEVNAYDLVRTHALVLRDSKRNEGGIYERETEYCIEELFALIGTYVSRFDLEKLRRERDERKERLSYPDQYGAERIALVEKYPQAVSAQDKMVIITKFINLMHYGGRLEGLSYLGGYPTSKEGGFERRQSDGFSFLRRLNNLGHQDPKDDMK